LWVACPSFAPRATEGKRVSRDYSILSSFCISPSVTMYHDVSEPTPAPSREGNSQDDPGVWHL